MIVSRPAAERGHADHGWLDSRHTFSFGHYYDPRWMGFGALRVINEDRLQPGGGFAPHRHANMEIISVMLSGALSHRDSGGHVHTLQAGEVQWMSAGHGIEHSEYNASEDTPAHFLQVWIQPDRVNAAPAYAHRAFERSARIGRWATLVSPDGAEGSLAMRQQAGVRACVLPADARIETALDPQRRYWLQAVAGTGVANGHRLGAGDALGFVDEAGALLIENPDEADSEWLLFDLPR